MKPEPKSEFENLKAAFNTCERALGTDAADTFVRGYWPEYTGALDSIPETIRPGLIWDLKESVKDKPTFAAQMMKQHTRNGVRDGRIGVEDTQPVVDSEAIWKKFSGAKAAKVTKPTPNSVVFENDDDGDEQAPAQTDDELSARAWRTWNKPRKAPAK